MNVIGGNADSLHTYFEKNITKRGSTQFKLEKTFANKHVLTLKNSLGYFERSLTQQDHAFSGLQVSSFSEINYLIARSKSEWIFGGNLWTDNFKQTNSTTYSLNSNLSTAGVFAQNSFSVKEKLTIESGLRTDFNSKNNIFVLPRLAILYKFTPKLSARISGGMGYKAPTVFSEEAEEKGFRNIAPLDFSQIHSERSIGGSSDINYKTLLLGKLSFSINVMAFYTRLNDPLILSSVPATNGNYAFQNAKGYLDSKGFETNVKLKYKDFSLYVGHTFIDAIRHYDSVQSINPLTAKHRLYVTLMYEIEKKLRIGYEIFYTGKQSLSTGETRPGYWIMGVSAEWKFKHFSLFVNAENFTNVRQTRYESIYTGSLQNPQFKEIWSPTDGFIFNGGFKINVW